eukprot:scaffold2816_cov121-Cylindrotheca_fusiformis.AAC.45
MSQGFIHYSDKRQSLSLFQEDATSTSFRASGFSGMDIDQICTPNIRFEEYSDTTSATGTPTMKRRGSVASGRSFRLAMGDASRSPMKTARGQLNRNQPVSPMLVVESLRKSLRKTKKTARSVLGESPSDPKSWWRDGLDLPAETTEEQAFAVLLCRELESIDI